MMTNKQFIHGMNILLLQEIKLLETLERFSNK